MYKYILVAQPLRMLNEHIKPSSGFQVAFLSSKVIQKNNEDRHFSSEAEVTTSRSHHSPSIVFGILFALHKIKGKSWFPQLSAYKWYPCLFFVLF